MQRGEPREDERALAALARLHGIQRSYVDTHDRRIRASREAILATLGALGAPVAGIRDVPGAIRERHRWSWERPLEPVMVAWDGRLDELTLRVPLRGVGGTVACRIELEGGGLPFTWRGRGEEIGGAELDGRRFVQLRLRADLGLPLGYHALTVRAGTIEADALVIAAPKAAPATGPGRAWGLSLPLHALRSRRSFGVGDLTDLARLTEWVAGLGGRAVGPLPLHAALGGPLFEPSPYSPASRLCWNEAYLDLERLPELAASEEARRVLSSNATRLAARRLLHAPLVDLRAAAELKLRVLEAVTRDFLAQPGGSPRRRAHRAFLRANPTVADYAVFRAACDRRATPWWEWDEPERSGRLSRRRDIGADVHAYAQWALAEQLEDVAAGARASGATLYLDVPLGVNAAGYDVWREPGLFALRATVGAPPDDFFAKGQDWGFPPMRSDAVRERRYRYPIACLRTVLRHASLVRLDHVMGLHRLFWVPKGFAATDGVYVRGRPEEGYAILTLEAARSGATIVGEDLGTVPRSLRPSMARHGIRRSWVLPLELTGKGLKQPTARSVASLNTHDLFPFAGFWRGMDLDLWRERGWLDGAGERAARATRRTKERALTALLRRQGWLGPGDPSESDVLDALLRFLAASDAGLLMVGLDDLLGETRPQNVPGTTGGANWRRPAREPFERFRALPQVTSTLRAVDALRSTQPR